MSNSNSSNFALNDVTQQPEQPEASGNGSPWDSSSINNPQKQHVQLKSDACSVYPTFLGGVNTMVVPFLIATLMVVNTLQLCSKASKLDTKRNSVSDTERQKFIPSHEWQIVRDGQVIPAGLHYRMNLQTGLKEAKLLDGNQVSDPRSAVVLASRKLEINVEEVEKRDKHSNGFNTAPSEDVNANANAHPTFSSYESLKKEFQELNLLIKTDAELMNELLARFTLKNIGKDIDEQEIVNILTDLEYLVHHYDNAQEFARMGGITQVVYPCLNSSSVAVRSEAILLLGSAIQSNPRLQIIALETGSINSLLRLLMLDNSPVIRARAIYALSCLTRRFPTAQLKMINAGGLYVLGELYQNESQDDLKLQIKVITLLYDLVMEYKDANNALKVTNHDTNWEELVEKRRQYQMVNLPQRLTETGWCKRLPRLLSISAVNTRQTERDDLSSVIAYNVPIRPEHDVVEKIIEAMLALVDYCIEDFRSDPNVQEIVLSLEKWYGELSVREQLGKKTRDSDAVNDHYFYYTSLAKLVRELAEKLKFIKDEL